MSSMIFELLKQESTRQEATINLIASENYVSPEILQIVGSCLTNKYAEGYPGKRYYAGCQIIDKIECAAIDAAKKLFGAEHANVQPHSGSQANAAVYTACLKPGDTVVAMSLAAGGHLTHGHKLNFSGSLYTFIPYGVDKNSGLIDYQELENITLQHRPKLIVAGASSYPHSIDFERISAIAKKHGALFLVDMAHIAGLVAASLHQSPVPFADFVTSTTHKTLRGPRGGLILCKQEWAKKIDMAVFPGLQGGPAVNIIAAKAQTFEEAQTKEFLMYQKQVLENAQAMTNTFKNLGYKIVADGTATHLFLLDLQTPNSKNNQTWTGKEAEELLESCNIIVNRNVIPFDTLTPLNPSGIRIGTPAMTTRGMRKEAMVEVVQLIDAVLNNKNNEAILNKIREKIAELCKKFLIPK